MTTKPQFSENHEYVIRDVEAKELESSCDTHSEALILLANAESIARQNGFISPVPLYEIVTMEQCIEEEIEYFGNPQNEDEVKEMTTRYPPLCGECFGDPRLEK